MKSNIIMKNNHRLPVEFSLGMLKCKGTIEKKLGKENEVYFHTVCNTLKPANQAFDADFYPIKIELLDRILIKWECKSKNIAESLKYPLAAAIEKRLRESHIPLF